MKNSLSLVLAISLGTLTPSLVSAQSHYSSIEPESSQVKPNNHGNGAARGRTHVRILNIPAAAPTSVAKSYNTPATIRRTYALPATGGSNAIAIVDAFDFPTALADFNAFSQHFALPRETSNVPTSTSNQVFEVVYASGVKPASGGSFIASWNLEAALDIEWAHAMAPNAKIYLVEAASDSTDDLLTAVRVASNLPGVKEVSMSWGGGETSFEASTYDPVFTTPGIVYLASGGDSGGVMEYPAASPNVISCGGTTITRAGNAAAQAGWSDTGCGYSTYEPRPSFQSSVVSVVGNQRGVSDIAFDADPNSGVYVYDSTPLYGESGWWILGGTSVSAPALAGVINVAGTLHGFAPNTAAEQARIYGNMGNKAAFTDVVTGTAGGFKCKPGYDLVTGVGSPHGITGL
jgi:subtilase family serine protease